MKTIPSWRAAAVAACALAALASGSLASAAPAGSHQSIPQNCTGSTVLYNQVFGANAGDVNSQNYGPGFSAYDNAAADDFVVPASVSWKIKRVIVRGDYFNGSGPTPSVDVTFYDNNGGVPGNTQCSYPGMLPVSWGASPGNLQINNLSCTLPSGSYFVSVVANMTFATGGEWGWRSHTAQNFLPAVWQNPGGGFGTCTAWGDMATCLGQSGVDLDFRLRGCSF